MASTRSSKRTASEALAPAAPVEIDASTTTFPAAIHDVEGGDASLLHKSKKIATDATVAAKSMAADATVTAKSMAADASVAIKGAVHSAIEATTAAAASAKAFVEKKMENQTSTTTVTKPPYAMEATEPAVKSTEPSLLDKAKLMASHAGEQIVAAAKTVESSVEHASQTVVHKVQSGELLADVKAGANTMAASISSTASQLSASLAHKTGSEVSARDSGIDTTLQPKDLQVSDASHSKEKADGSLPMERNADEFSTNAKPHETRADSQLKAGHSGLGTDSSIDKVDSFQPGASDKLQDVQLAGSKVEQPDLLTGDNAQLTA